MSFAASVARELMLIARENDLTFQIQLISQNLQQLQILTARLALSSVSQIPGTPAALAVDARQAAFAQIGKVLEVQINNLRIQREAVTTEIQAVRKVITRNISTTFKTFA